MKKLVVNKIYNMDCIERERLEKNLYKIKNRVEYNKSQTLLDLFDMEINEEKYYTYNSRWLGNKS